MAGRSLVVGVLPLSLCSVGPLCLITDCHWQNPRGGLFEVCILRWFSRMEAVEAGRGFQSTGSGSRPCYWPSLPSSPARGTAHVPLTAIGRLPADDALALPLQTPRDWDHVPRPAHPQILIPQPTWHGSALALHPEAPAAQSVRTGTLRPRLDPFLPPPASCFRRET